MERSLRAECIARRQPIMSVKGARPNEARIAPHLLVSDGERALQFYAAAFGATVLFRSPMPGGNGIHAQIRIAESTVLITTIGLARTRIGWRSSWHRLTRDAWGIFHDSRALRGQ